MIAIGFLLGFVGYLPLGNINLTVVQMAVNDTRSRLQLFILFAAVMEFIYCFICLFGMKVLIAQASWLFWLNWSAVVIFLALGLVSFIPVKSEAAAHTSSVRRGVLVAIFNPLQIPFWLVWGVYVMDRGWVKPSWTSIGFFSLLCALGTIAILWLYALAGKKIVEKLKLNRNLLNRIIGSLLILLAVLQTFKNLK